MADLLYQSKFPFAHFQELVDLAVVITGLGVLQSRLDFVETAPSYWDPSQWEYFPRKFLDARSLGHANAMAAWLRGETKPTWSQHFVPGVKRAMNKSLKYLTKTNDSFLLRDNTRSQMSEVPQAEWKSLASGSSTSSQIIALRHLTFSADRTAELQELIVDSLRSPDSNVILHAICAIEKMKLALPGVIEELKLLVEHSDDVVRSKALCSLALFKQLDEHTIGLAAKMLDSQVAWVEFAGIFALSSLDEVPEAALLPASRGLIRALQNCSYATVGHYVTGFDRWMDKPEAYFEDLLRQDGPEYLEIVLEALKNVRDNYVPLS